MVSRAMHKYLWWIVIGACGLITGCGKESEAHPNRTRDSSRVLERSAQLRQARLARTGGTATSTPKETKEVLDKVKVEVQQVEKIALRDSDPEMATISEGYMLLAVKVSVTSRQQQPILLVDPQRFVLTGESGEPFPMRLSARKQPILPTMYLEDGQTVEGWLTFEVPEVEDSFSLKTDLRSPAIVMPVVYSG